MGSAHRERLEALAGDLAWSWSTAANRLFEDLGGAIWRQVGHDPWALLRAMSDAELDAAVQDRGLEPTIAAAEEELTHLGGEIDPSLAQLRHRPVAYLSAEFGLHESLPIYSGGLGVLAGDHLKSASDRGVPLVGVGLFYREGYFEQTLDAAGWQQERYPTLAPEAKGLRPALDAGGEPLRITVPVGRREVAARVWVLRVGRVQLLLLDSDVAPNAPDDRALTRRLYGGDERTRLHQELLLGVGGVRALRALGIRPSVFHLNEGHSAFACLELAAERLEREGHELDEALAEVGETIVFTTHTPVAAGHDRFAAGLVTEELASFIPRLGLTQPSDLLALGRLDPSDESAPFCMTTLALRVARRRNGVSFLHGRVSRRMWQPLWPARERWEIPIGHVTNGVHLPTWMAPAMQEFLDARLDPGWRQRATDPKTWAPALTFDDEALWRLRVGLRRDLLAEVRRRAEADARRRGESEAVVRAMGAALDEGALLVGFARRFATYKRAALLADDLDFLDALVNAPGRPVNVVFAGKAHPRDDGGKRLIQRLFELSRDPRFLGKLVVLEGYDMALGKVLTRGVDVWLNNPRRPLEASGTSGQKVALNGGLNCSILDGWWAEAFDGDNGFAIGDGEVHRDPKLQDRRDAEALRRTLAEEVVPLFFDRSGGVPRRWLARVKRSLGTLPWRFCSDRMVLDYVRQAYAPAAGALLAEAR